jgi:UDP-N-acetylglucosamine 1-carboxyvinyltransferase
MDKIVLRGGRPLNGVVPIAGAKNAALPILMATLVAPGRHRLVNVPELVDVSTTLSLLGRIGCPSLVSPGTVQLDTTRISYSEAPYDLVRKMRASVLALGPLLARCGEAKVSLPGGCAIGMRPIDQHLKGLEALGAKFQLEDGYVYGQADKLVGNRIPLDVPTVTGTENILMAAVLAEGESRIENAAREPEIVDLANFLNSLGAKIEGAGTSILKVQGVTSMAPPAEAYSILPDRIEAATYLIAGAITGGDLTIRGACVQDLQPVIAKLRETGCEITIDGSDIRIQRTGPIRSVNLSTEPHPGFPTDVQAQFMALMTLGDGVSEIHENIFENRFMHVPELGRMGAQVEVSGNTARITGVSQLNGATVMATDLRASASLVLAGLSTPATTQVLRLYHLDRGYERLVEKLLAIGADVARVPQERDEFGKDSRQSATA